MTKFCASTFGSTGSPAEAAAAGRARPARPRAADRATRGRVVDSRMNLTSSAYNGPAGYWLRLRFHSRRDTEAVEDPGMDLRLVGEAGEPPGGTGMGAGARLAPEHAPRRPFRVGVTQRRDPL